MQDEIKNRLVNYPPPLGASLGGSFNIPQGIPVAGNGPIEPNVRERLAMLEQAQSSIMSQLHQINAALEMLFNKLG